MVIKLTSDQEKNLLTAAEEVFGYCPCLHCRHYQGARKCKAFSEVPMEIYTGRDLHIEEYEGDNGIRFEEAS